MNKSILQQFTMCGPMLLVLFVALKLTGHISWPWWWVVSPLWIVLLLGRLAFLGACAIVAIAKGK